MNKIKQLRLTACLTVVGSSVFAVDVQQSDAQQLSGRCVSCHGTRGISSSPLYPNLASQKAAYLLKQMRDFQTGNRADPIMGAMVKGLSEADMDALANYYSKMK